MAVHTIHKLMHPMIVSTGPTPAASNKRITPTREIALVNGLFWLAHLEDHLAKPHVLPGKDFITSSTQSTGELVPRIARDMFMRIRAGQDFSIDPLKHPPEPTAIVRRSHHQDPARPKDPPHLRPVVRRVRDMLDHFGADHSGKTRRSEREPVAARSHQQAMARLEPPQFTLEGVQPHRVGQVLDDPAGSAPDVQDAIPVFQKAEDDPMSRSLPVSLQPDRAVEGPVIVIGRGNGVAQCPHPPQGFREGPSEMEEPYVGAAGAT